MPTAFLSLLFIPVISNYASSSPTSLPCWHSVVDNQSLWCDQSYLEIPTNFNGENIPNDVRELVLSFPDESRRTCGIDVYCNVLKTAATPFPARPHLRAIRFYGFKGEGGVRFSVNTLLKNVRQNLTELRIYWSRIPSLDAEYFRGFTALEELYLLYNRISAVAPDTFQSLSSNHPGLHFLSLSNNRIRSFDWAVLQPVANSLKTFSLSSQQPGLQRIYRSSPKFSLKNVADLTLEDNKLQTIPKEVFDTLDSFPHNNTVFRLHNNPFCAADDECTCCEFKELQNWISFVNQTATDGQDFRFVLQCGRSPYLYEPKITKTKGAWRVQETKHRTAYDIDDLAYYPSEIIC